MNGITPARSRMYVHECMDGRATAERRNSSDATSDSSSSEASGTLVSSSSHKNIGIDDSTTIEPYQIEPEDSDSVDGQDNSLDLGNESADDNPQNDPRLGNTHWLVVNEQKGCLLWEQYILCIAMDLVNNNNSSRVGAAVVTVNQCPLEKKVSAATCFS